MGINKMCTQKKDENMHISIAVCGKGAEHDKTALQELLIAKE